MDIARNEIEREKEEKRGTSNGLMKFFFFTQFMYRNGDDRESLTSKIDILPASFDRIDREVARGVTKDARSEYRVTAPARYALTESEGDGARGQTKEGRDADLGPGSGSGPSCDDRENKNSSVRAFDARERGT